MNSKYFLYARKSSEAEDRQILSIKSQIKELEELAKRLNLSIVEIFTEAQSAKAPGRPIFNQMMQRIYQGEAQGIICWKLDRLARNPVDGGTIIWAIKQNSIEIVTPSQRYSQASENSLLMYVEFGMAQKFIDDLSKNVKRGLKTKAESGWYPAMAPAGYMHDFFAQKGNKKILKDPERFDLVKKALLLVVQGEQPMKVLDKLNNKWGFRTRKMGKLGGKPLSRSGWYYILSNPFYYGEYEYPVRSDKWHKGKHELMITRGEFETIQHRLGKHGNRRPQKREFAFTGLMRCGECGCMITAEEKWQTICTKCKTKFTSTHRGDCPNCKTDVSQMKNPTISHYIYYHCTKKKRDLKCTQGYIRREDLESQIDEFLCKIQISERFKNWAIKYLQKTHEKEVRDRTTINQSLQSAYNQVQEKLDKLLDLKLAEQITDEEYQRKKQELLGEKRNLTERLGDTDDRANKWLSLAEKTFDFACHARYWFTKGTKEDKRTILSSIGLNLTLKDRKLYIDALKPFVIIKDTKDEVFEISPRFEPKERGLTEGQMEQFYYANPLLLPR